MLLLSHIDIVKLSNWGEQYTFYLLLKCYWFLKCWYMYMLYPTNYIGWKKHWYVVNSRHCYKSFTRFSLQVIWLLILRWFIPFLFYSNITLKDTDFNNTYFCSSLFSALLTNHRQTNYLNWQFINNWIQIFSVL